MQHLEVSCAVRHIYIHVVRRQRAKALHAVQGDLQTAQQNSRKRMLNSNSYLLHLLTTCFFYELIAEPDKAKHFLHFEKDMFVEHILTNLRQNPFYRTNIFHSTAHHVWEAKRTKSPAIQHRTE